MFQDYGLSHRKTITTDQRTVLILNTGTPQGEQQVVGAEHSPDLLKRIDFIV